MNTIELNSADVVHFELFSATRLNATSRSAALDLLFFRLAAHARRKLQALHGDVYKSESRVDGFEIFINTSGNIALYESVETVVLTAWRQMLSRMWKRLLRKAGQHHSRSSSRALR